MSLSSAARATLECLKSEFETGSATYPKLRHVLIKTPDVEAFKEADIESSMLFSDRRIQPLWREPTETQIFIDDDGFPRGREAFEAFRKLAMSTVKVLIGQGVFEPAESPPDHSGGWCSQEKENHYAREWMRFVHRYAKEHTGAWPESESTTYLEHRQLTKGGMVHTLTPGVFKASSLTIAGIIRDVQDHAPDATSRVALERLDSGGGPLSEQEPFVIRTPNGTVFTYGNAAAAHKIDIDAMATDHIAEARRVDPMPEPEAITVGEMIDFITFIARASQEFPYLLAMPEVGQQCNRREMVLSASPGWKAFQEWRDIEHHRKTPLEAANELLALLVGRFRKPSKELRLMPLLDAFYLLGQPETASPPAAAERDEQTAAPDTEQIRPSKACPHCGKRYPPLTPICDVCHKPMPLSLEECTRDAWAANWFRPEAEKTAAAPAPGTEAPQMNPPRAAARGDARETERRVAEKLRDNPRAKSREIFEATGISEQRVRNTRAWKNRERQKELRPQDSVRAMPLTGAMLAVIDSKADDPAEIAAEREIAERQEHARSDGPEVIEPMEMLQRRYLEGAVPSERARFHKLNPTDQELELTAWKLTGMRGD
jgi:hypothetical protein